MNKPVIRFHAEEEIRVYHYTTYTEEDFNSDKIRMNLGDNLTYDELVRVLDEKDWEHNFIDADGISINTLELFLDMLREISMEDSYDSDSLEWNENIEVIYPNPEADAKE